MRDVVMPVNTNSQPEPPVRLDQILESAVTQNWNELMPDSKSGLIHIEYETRSDGALDFLFIWASTIPGYWNLVCELWMRPLWSHVAGLRFGNDYHSADFTSKLEFVMAHVNEYANLPDRRGVIQIYPPAEVKGSIGRPSTNVVHNDYVPLSKEQHVA